jgi:hypothetical protein
MIVYYSVILREFLWVSATGSVLRSNNLDNLF